MSEVFKEYYEVIEEGVEAMRTFFEEYDIIANEQNLIAIELGGAESIIDFNGRMIAVAFEDRPDQNWKILQEDFNGTMYVASPKKNTKIGKALYQQIEDAPKLPNDSNVKQFLGWDRDMQVSHNHTYYRANFIRVEYPTTRYFIHIPRQVNDNWKPGYKLFLKTKMDILTALNEHNRIIEERNGMNVDF